jgi:hypothetical protein
MSISSGVRDKTPIFSITEIIRVGTRWHTRWRSQTPRILLVLRLRERWVTLQRACNALCLCSSTVTVLIDGIVHVSMYAYVTLLRVV